MGLLSRSKCRKKSELKWKLYGHTKKQAKTQESLEEYQHEEDDIDRVFFSI